jgi:lipooligosaccharide transport system permease protein
MSLAARLPRRGLRLIERNLAVYRHTWLVLFSGFFEPVFYLLGIGVGIGALVGQVHLDDGRAVPYAVFVAPALMASSAMNGAIYEATFNLFFKLRYAHLYEAVLATPLGAGDVAIGEVGWALIRGGLYSVGFLVVMALMGFVRSPFGILAWPASILIGLAFAAVGTATTTLLRRWEDFDIVQLVLVPLFLFSGTFFPISSYPAAIRWVVEVTPLYRGVHLIRGLTTGAVEPALLFDCGYLCALGVAGVVVTRIRLDALLRK